jgi:hypothetical protein
MDEVMVDGVAEAVDHSRAAISSDMKK